MSLEKFNPHNPTPSVTVIIGTGKSKYRRVIRTNKSFIDAFIGDDLCFCEFYYDRKANRIGMDISSVNSKDSFRCTKSTNGGIHAQYAQFSISGFIRKHPEIKAGKYTNIYKENVDGKELVVIDLSN